MVRVSGHAPAAPAATVVIPTYRRPDALARCLAALAVQTLDPAMFEVIVVDDGSGDPPHEIVQQAASRLQVRLVTRDNGGPGAARNTGVAEASGRWVAFTDDDCTPEPGWLAALLRAAQAQPDALVGGRVENALTDNPFAEASQLLTSWLVHWYAHPDRYHRRFFTTNDMILPREAFLALGGFDTTALADTAEDRDLCDRWRGRGWPMVYEPGAVVRHAHRMSLRGFVAQHHNYGRGAVYFHTAGGRNASAARKPESPKFYFGMLAFPFSRHRLPRAAGYSLLLLLSQVVYVAGYFSERIRPVKRVRT